MTTVVKVEALWLRLFVCRIINDLPLILHKCQGQRQADRKQTGAGNINIQHWAGRQSSRQSPVASQTEVNNQYHLITLITLFVPLVFCALYTFCCFVLWGFTLSDCDSRYPNAFVTGGIAECLDDSSIKCIIALFCFCFLYALHLAESKKCGYNAWRMWRAAKRKIQL